MKLFIWEDLKKMSDSYHSDGGVVVIAESLERAHELLRGQHQEGWHYKKNPETGQVEPDLTRPCMENWVPEDSDVFTTEPTHTYVLDPSDRADERVMVFPDAGCC